MTRDEMIEYYGPGTMISVHAAMEEAGIKEPDPGELFAIVYRDAEAADAWSDANWLHHGNPEFYRHPRCITATRNSTGTRARAARCS